MTVTAAAGTGAILGGPTGYSVMEVANIGVALAIIIAGGLSVFYIFIGGISFILSGGQEDKIKQAVHTIRYAIIGLLVTIFAVTIIAIIGNIFDFNLVSYINWSKMGELMEKITGSFGNMQGGGSLR